MLSPLCVYKQKTVFIYSHGNSSGRVCGCEEKFDLMTGGGGGDKNRSLEARGLRTLALKQVIVLSKMRIK